MSGAHEGRAPKPENGRRRVTAYGEYSAARDRYFEILRVDSEIRRLERVWRLPGVGDPQGPGDTTRHD